MESRYNQSGMSGKRINNTSPFAMNYDTDSKHKHDACLCVDKIAHGAYGASVKKRAVGQRPASQMVKKRKASGCAQLMVCNHTSMIKQT